MKRKARADQLEIEASKQIKRMKADNEGKKDWISLQKVKAMSTWSEHMEKGTDEMYRQMYGENWEEMRILHLQKLALEQVEATEKQKDAETFLNERKDETEVKITGFKF